MIDPLTPAEKAALNYCAPRGIALSVFLGRVVYPGDPQWEDRDTWAAMQWLVDQNGACSGCGQPRAKSMLPEMDAPDYEVEVTRCWACEAMQTEMKNWQESGASPAGAYFTAKERSGGDVPVGG